MQHGAQAGLQADAIGWGDAGMEPSPGLGRRLDGSLLA